MSVQISQYRRHDGVTMLLHENGQWLIRKINGPAWFYLKNFGWKYSPALTQEGVASCTLPFEEAYELLETVKI